MRNLLALFLVVASWVVVLGCHPGTGTAGGGGEAGAGGTAGSGGEAGAGGTAVCALYCGSADPGVDLPGRCLVASEKLGKPASGVVRQCPHGIVPEGCFSLSDYSPGVESEACDGSGATDAVLCCQN